MTQLTDLHHLERVYKVKMVLLKEAERDTRYALCKEEKIREDLQTLERKLEQAKQGLACCE